MESIGRTWSKSGTSKDLSITHVDKVLPMLHDSSHALSGAKRPMGMYAQAEKASWVGTHCRLTGSFLSSFLQM